MREADVTSAASQHYVREFERAGASALVVDGERRCRLDARPDSNRGTRRGRPDVIARMGSATMVVAIESKSTSSLSAFASRSAPIVPGARTGSPIEQAAAYPADYRVLALACDLFEEAPELESAVLSEAERLGVGLVVVHGRDWVELLLQPEAHACPDGDWLGHYERGEELRARLAEVG